MASRPSRPSSVASRASRLSSVSFEGERVPEVITDDATLHVAVDGAGEPVTVFAHGLTNSSVELAAFTPMAPGTKVRFDFRGHGRSSTPPAGAYRFADFARDLDAVAAAYGATNAVGTSLGAGALTHLLGERPDRFARLVFLLPAALDVPIGDHALFDRTADLLETLPRDEAIESHPGRVRTGGELRDPARTPGLRSPAVAGHEPAGCREGDPRGDPRRGDRRPRATPCRERHRRSSSAARATRSTRRRSATSSPRCCRTQT